MLIFLFLLTGVFVLSKIGLPILLADISKNFHQQCLFHLPHISSQDWVGSLVCGERLSNPLIYKLLIDTSLVHLLVISVGHLQMLSWALEQTDRFQQFPTWARKGIQIFRWLVLFGFALTSGFHPPVARALFAEALRSLNERFRWHWSLFTITTASGLLALAYQPMWIFALGLYLPWICCLGFCIVAFHRDTRHHHKENIRELLITATLIQILLVIPLGEFRWEGVVANAFLMPLFGLFLFPVSALTYLFRFLGPACDFFFWCFEKLLRWVLSLMGSHSSTPIPYFYPKTAWSLIIALSVMIQILYRYRWRGRHD